MKIDGTRSHNRVLQYYAAFNRGDWPAMLDCLTDDVVHDLNQGGARPARSIRVPRTHDRELPRAAA